MPHPWEANWRVLQQLGKGGQGITFLVEMHSDSSCRGVLKRLKDNRNPANRARMHREVASLESLAPFGAAVPKVLEHNTAAAGDSGGLTEMYLVMEFIPGPTLKEYVTANRVLGIDEAVRFVLSLCSTLNVARIPRQFFTGI